jgi:predicted patatin/cPLA2 family phospholipase
MKKDIDLVLTGGGGKGVFQVGALNYLEHNYHKRVKHVFATSVGILNALFFIAEETDHMITEYWLKYISKEKSWISNHSFLGVLGSVYHKSLFSPDYLYEMIDTQIDGILDKVLKSDIKFEFTVTNYTRQKTETILNKNISIEKYKQYIKAGISGNIAFPLIVIDGCFYGDGEVLGDYGAYKAANQTGKTIILSNYCISPDGAIPTRIDYGSLDFLSICKQIVSFYVGKHLEFEIRVAREKDKKLIVIFPEDNSKVAKLSPFSFDFSDYDEIIRYGRKRCQSMLGKI